MRLPIAIASLLMPVLAFATAEPFLDTVGHPHENQIDLLREKGIVEGYGYGIFRPDIPINRAEFLKIMMVAVYGEESFGAGGQCFTDFTGEELWYWTYACTAKERGILSGHPDGSFRGESTVNLAEAIKMAVEAWEIPKPVYFREPDHWYDPYMDAVADTGIPDYFDDDAGHLLTRSDMAYVLVSLGEPLQTIDGDGDEEPEPLKPGICGNDELNLGEQCDDGNTEDGDGCSSICIVVPEPTRHAALKLEQLSMGSDDIATGAKGVPLIRFDAIAGRQDVKLTGIRFGAQTGDLTDAQNYALYADTDQDGDLDGSVATAVPQGGVLSFTGLQISVRDGMRTLMEVRADITGTEGSSLRLGFATNNDRYVEAVGVTDGRDLSGIVTDDGECSVSICWIWVQTRESGTVTVGGQGNLYVTKSSTPVPSRLMLAGEQSASLLRVNFRATGEDVRVTDIAFTGAGESLDRLELYTDGSSTPFAMATPGGCASSTTGRFCASTDFIIHKDEERAIYLRARVRPDTEGAESGDTVALTISATTGGPLVAIAAEGVASQAELDQNDGDGVAEGEIFIGTQSPAANSAIVGSTSDVSFAKIIGIANGSNDPDNTPVPVGSATLGMFRFQAAMHNNSATSLNAIRIRELTFTVTATNINIDASSFRLFNKLDATVVATCSASGQTGVITVVCPNLHQSMMSTVIDAGDDIILGLKGTVSVPGGSSTRRLQVQLQNLTDRSDPGGIEWSDGEHTFTWVDLSESDARSTYYKD